MESIISLSELPCCIICEFVGNGSCCMFDALDFFLSFRDFPFLKSLSGIFLLSVLTFSGLCFFSENWIRSALYFATSISVFPVDSVTVSVSSYSELFNGFFQLSKMGMLTV